MGRYDQHRWLRYIIGGSSVLAAFLLLLHGNSQEAIVQITLIYFIVACTIDTHRSKIPNWLNASLALAGLAFGFWWGNWPGLFVSLCGLVLGFVLLIVPWLMGGFGAGDVKALTALGAVLGPMPLLQVFIYMAFFGGGHGAPSLCVRERPWDEDLRMVHHAKTGASST